MHTLAVTELAVSEHNVLTGLAWQTEIDYTIALNYCPCVASKLRIYTTNLQRSVAKIELHGFVSSKNNFTRFHKASRCCAGCIPRFHLFRMTASKSNAWSSFSNYWKKGEKSDVIFGNKLVLLLPWANRLCNKCSGCVLFTTHVYTLCKIQLDAHTHKTQHIRTVYYRIITHIVTLSIKYTFIIYTVRCATAHACKSNRVHTYIW